MTKNYTKQEFIEYVKNLEFYELEDVANYIKEYFEHYDSIPEENKEEKQLAWEKYVVLLAKYGHWLFSFTLMVIEMRKEIETVKAEAVGQNS